MRKARSQQGFTLLEIAIVLLIITLIVGGIIVATQLIRSAQLRAVIAEEQRFVKAAELFRDKYMALPGDYDNAESHWGALAVDGNGDGRIGSWGSGGTVEWFNVWRHLYLAKLIDFYVPSNAPVVSNHLERIPGVNIPASRLEAAGWTMLFASSSEFSSIPYVSGDIEPRHVLWLGGSLLTNFETHPVLSPSEAQEIDDKMDDGNATTGRVVMEVNAMCNSGYLYLISNTDAECSAFFKTGF